MTLETFTTLLANMQADNDRTQELYKLDINTLSYDLNSKIIKALGIEAFGEVGWDWIEWYCWESDFGQRKDMNAHDKDGKAICYDVESLWRCVMGE